MRKRRLIPAAAISGVLGQHREAPLRPAPSHAQRGAAVVAIPMATRVLAVNRVRLRSEFV